MSTSFYGNIIRGKFPLKSKIRLEDDSVGARMLNTIGSDIENTYRRKIFSHNTCTYISTPTALNNLETLYRYDLLQDTDYRSKVMLERVDKVTINGKDNVKSLEELYNSAAVKYNFGTTITTDDPLLTALNGGEGKEVIEAIELNKESYIYVNVKQVTKTEDESQPVSSGICIRGKDKNLNPIEETIQIDSERMYVTKQKFFRLEPLAQDIKRNISGGPSVSLSDFKEFDIEILKYPCKTWLDNQVDSRDLEPAKTKRIQIDTFISKPKRDEIILEGAVGDNTLVVELVEVTTTVDGSSTTSTKLKYIHRYFNDLNAYRNEFNSTSDPYDVEEHIFEAVLGEVALADSSGARIKAIDFDYNIVDGHLYVLDENKNIYLYEIGNKEAGSNKVSRTYNPGIRIDVLEEMFLPGEEVIVRLINTSLDLPLNSFIVGKVEREGDQERLQFLNEDKVFNDTTIGVFNPLSSGADLQDSLELFSFNTTVNSSDIELFVICFAGTAANRKVINDYNNQPDQFTPQLFLNAIDAKQINTKKLICNLIEPKKTYSPIADDFEIKHLYFKGTDRSLWVVDDGDTHHQFKPEYDEFYFANNAIFKTKEATGLEEYSFTLLNGETVEVTINEQNN